MRSTVGQPRVVTSFPNSRSSARMRSEEDASEMSTTLHTVRSTIRSTSYPLPCGRARPFRGFVFRKVTCARVVPPSAIFLPERLRGGEALELGARPEHD